ncbi:MAG: MmcQ/YjbR family DNA-binding protein [Hyphomonas sp.]
MITPAKLRAAALALARAVERPHFSWPGFRVDVPKGKIFCTLPPHYEFSNLFLTPQEQRMLGEADPAIFFPVPNTWGQRGTTSIRLKACDATTLRSALVMSWRHAVPSKLNGERKP